jgi:murein DD-endopeptidase MepM/ murein hydrolase activator NlpD
MRLAVLTLVIASFSLGLQAAPKRPAKKHSSRPAVQPADGQVHVVKKGETAAQVARTNDLSLNELKALNPGLNLARLAVGARLKIGQGRAQAAALQPVDADLPTRQRIPLAALPAAPPIQPSPMPHLERLLPYQVKASLPASGSGTSAHQESHLPPATTAQLLARIQPVMPPVSDAELNALLPTYAPADPDRLDLLWPVETRTISSAWGPRMRTRTVRVKNQRKKRIRYRGRHKGVDLTAPSGASVFAALDGTVVMSGKHKQYGNYVMVEHGNGVVTLYAHHRLNLVHEGDIVRRGQKIAEVGRTGNATGPHLHFELRIDGVQRNPLPVLNDEEEIPAEVAAHNALLGSGSLR